MARIHLFDVAVHMAQVFLLGTEILLGTADDPGDEEEGEGEDHQRHQSHPAADGQHHHQHAHQGGDSGDHLGQALVQGGRDCVHVIGDQAEHLAVGGLIVKAERQFVHLAVDLIPQPVRDLLGHAAHQKVLQVREQGGKQDEASQQQKDLPDGFQVHPRAALQRSAQQIILVLGRDVFDHLAAAGHGV